MKIVVLIAATFRELLSKATLFVLAGISTVILLGVVLGLSSEQTTDGLILKIFGAQATPPSSVDNIAELVRQMQSGFAGGLLIGITLFGVIATAGIIPDTLEKGIVDLYLSKPLARWQLLLGKFLGAVTIVFVNAAYFLGGLWLIFGIKVGVWNVGLLLAAFTMAFVFACLFSIVAFLGVLSRGAVVPIIGAFLYLLIIGALLQHREQSLYAMSGNAAYRGIVDTLYYLLPQLGALKDGVGLQILQRPVDWKPFVQAFLSSCVVFGATVGLLVRRDF
jgi:ABC-type transport system involved in multi-copper enzyme maturation permease subunit